MRILKVGSIVAVVAGLALALPAVQSAEAVPPAVAATAAAHQKPPKTKRHVMIAEYDWDGNYRLEKKEVKAFKEAHPRAYDALMGFCDVAKDNPRAHDVRLPVDVKPKKVKCKKKKIYKPYLMAWARRGEPIEGPIHP